MVDPSLARPPSRTPAPAGGRRNAWSSSLRTSLEKVLSTGMRAIRSCRCRSRTALRLASAVRRGALSHRAEKTSRETGHPNSTWRLEDPRVLRDVRRLCVLKRRGDDGCPVPTSASWASFMIPVRSDSHLWRCASASSASSW